MPLDPIEDIIEEIRQGKMVILMDDEDRENEGDLIMSAEKVTEVHINFMAKFARGLICMPMQKEYCERLHLPLMVSGHEMKAKTNFTVSIEAREGVTTGISAQDRAHTIRVAAAKDAKPNDLVRPGHVFPIMAQPGGVLARAGHTEASCDLARLAGLSPIAVIAEIMNDDGTMARRKELEVFAKEHNLKMGTIADLIQYRLRHEATIERYQETTIDTRYGAFQAISFRDRLDGLEHLALVRGKMDADTPTLVRVLLRNVVRDIPMLQGDDLSWPLDAALSTIAKADHGVAIILANREDGQDVIARLKQRTEADAPPVNATHLWRVGTGSQILSSLGVKQLRVMGPPKKAHGLTGFGIEILEYIPFAFEF